MNPWPCGCFARAGRVRPIRRLPFREPASHEPQGQTESRSPRMRDWAQDLDGASHGEFQTRKDQQPETRTQHCRATRWKARRAWIPVPCHRARRKLTARTEALGLETFSTSSAIPRAVRPAARACHRGRAVVRMLARRTVGLVSGSSGQAICGRLAGYQDVNDAERPRVDPAMCQVVGGWAKEKEAASTSEMSRFETEMLGSRERRVR